MKPGSKGWKNLMAKMYGIGASVVIIGALFKIQHWPGAGPMLVLGLGTEAIIFFFSAFEKPHEEPDWSLVYPELATPADGSKPKKGTITGQLDDMLAEANIEPALLDRLSDGMRHLGDQAEKMGKASDVSTAAQDYGDALSSASKRPIGMRRGKRKGSCPLVPSTPAVSRPPSIFDVHVGERRAAIVE